MKIAGLVLVVLGALALIYGGFGYNRQHTVLQVGSLKATATEHHQVPLSPLVGVVAIIGGVLLVITPRWRRA